jgi:transcriptional regulator with XRE-family HTH domain
MPKPLAAASIPHIVEKAIQSLGANISYARRRRGMKQSELARKAGITEVTLRRVERGSGTTGIAAYFTALWVLGLDREIKNIAAADRDEEGRTLERARAPKRARSSGVKLDDDF